MSGSSSLDHRSIFNHDGYLVIENLLNWQNDILPLVFEYQKLIDALAEIFLIEAKGVDKSQLDSLLGNYPELDFPDRFATLIGASGGRALHHLDPVLNIYSPDYQYRRDLPSAQIPPLFDFVRHTKLLDVIEELIGSEVYASPIYHLNIKLSNPHLMKAENIAKITRQRSPDEDVFYNFQVGQTNWHMDAVAGLSDSLDSRIVNAWIPITQAHQENGCLMVVPESHQLGLMKEIPPSIVEKSIKLEVKPGDVVFLDNKVLHASSPNNSQDEYRWAFNFRYLPPKQSCGRPFLPGFIARSRESPETELCNSYLWSSMWDRALAYVTNNGVPYTYADLGEITYDQAKTFTEDWRRLTPNHNSWLNLHKKIS